MTFSVDKTDDFDETDDLDDETQDSDVYEEDADVVDLEEDLDDQTTALSQAFREAAAADVEVEEDEDEVEVEVEEDEVEVEGDEDEVKVAAEVAADEDEKEDTTEAADDDDPEAYEQQLAEAIDALPDEDDLEVVLPPLVLPSLEVELFRPQEQSNYAYADAVTAYYKEKDYQRAIEKFGEAIENEAQRTDSNEIVAKAMYWQAEAYVKMQDIPQAIVTFESLIQACHGHYLSLAAQRRTAQLNSEGS